MENNDLPKSLQPTLDWRQNAKTVLETFAPAKTATLKLAAGETVMKRQLKRAIARQMGKAMVTQAKHAKRSSAKLKRSILRRRKIDAKRQAYMESKLRTGATAPKGRPIEFPPRGPGRSLRHKGGYIKIGGLFHV
jgi:hypothetical protein